jgi:hypothetical protein
MRSLEGLKNALSRIDAILGNPGVDTDERLVIRGETLPEKLAWLQEEVRVLEDEILGAKAELQALFEDADRARERSILADPASHGKVRDDLGNRTLQMRQEAGRLEQAFDALFDPEEEPR